MQSGRLNDEAIAIRKPALSVYMGRDQAEHAQLLPRPLCFCSERRNVTKMQAEFKGLKEEMLKEAQRGAKLEAKVAIVMRGHQDRHSKLDSRLQYQLQQARSVTTDLTCFR